MRKQRQEISVERKLEIELELLDHTCTESVAKQKVDKIRIIASITLT